MENFFVVCTQKRNDHIPPSVWWLLLETRYPFLFLGCDYCQYMERDCVCVCVCVFETGHILMSFKRKPFVKECEFSFKSSGCS